MDTSLVRKMEKAKDYAAQQPQQGRVTLMQCSATFRGDNSDHTISYDSGEWKCDCFYFTGHNECSHTMAMRLMLTNMVKEAAVS